MKKTRLNVLCGMGLALCLSSQAAEEPSVLFCADFMTKRFDREDGRRHHVQTLSAMAHFPMSVPMEVRAYEQLLAPAYDLTGSDFPSEDPWSAHGDRNQLSVNGKFREITDADLLAVADRFAIGTGPKVLKQVKDVFC